MFANTLLIVLQWSEMALLGHNKKTIEILFQYILLGNILFFIEAGVKTQAEILPLCLPNYSQVSS